MIYYTSPTIATLSALPHIHIMLDIQLKIGQTMYNNIMIVATFIADYIISISLQYWSARDELTSIATEHTSVPLSTTGDVVLFAEATK